MDLDFLRHFSFWRPVSRQPGRALLLGAGAAFFFIVLVGSDLYLDIVPTLTDVAGYLALSVVMSPLGALAIALKGGWIQQRFGMSLVIGLVVVVVLGVLAAWIIGAAA